MSVNTDLISDRRVIRTQPFGGRTFIRPLLCVCWIEITPLARSSQDSAVSSRQFRSFCMFFFLSPHNLFLHPSLCDLEPGRAFTQCSLLPALRCSECSPSSSVTICFTGWGGKREREKEREREISKCITNPVPHLY